MCRSWAWAGSVRHVLWYFSCWFRKGLFRSIGIGRLFIFYASSWRNLGLPSWGFICLFCWVWAWRLTRCRTLIVFGSCWFLWAQLSGNYVLLEPPVSLRCPGCSIPNYSIIEAANVVSLQLAPHCCWWSFWWCAPGGQAIISTYQSAESSSAADWLSWGWDQQPEAQLCITNCYVCGPCPFPCIEWRVEQE